MAATGLTPACIIAIWFTYPAFAHPMIRRFISKVFGRKPRASGSGAHILPQAKHGIRRDQLTDCALKTCETLTQAGFKGYLVGGAVRDLLLGKTPKDFDVATDATPEEVRRLFRRSRIIGRRFQIVHVMCGRETIEVTTFRSNEQKESDEDDERPTDEHGRLLSDNVFGSMADDAARRDFTINALYYDVVREEVHDYFGGVADCKKRVLRMIGDPDTRFREDPVRMLRAARFAAKLDFHIDPETRRPVATLAPLLGQHSARPHFRRSIETADVGPCPARRAPVARRRPAPRHAAAARHDPRRPDRRAFHQRRAENHRLHASRRTNPPRRHFCLARCCGRRCCCAGARSKPAAKSRSLPCSLRWTKCSTRSAASSPFRAATTA